MVIEVHLTPVSLLAVVLLQSGCVCGRASGNATRSVDETAPSESSRGEQSTLAAECSSSEEVVRVHRTSQGYSFHIWRVPSAPPAAADEVLEPVARSAEGTGGCAYRVWTYESDGRTRRLEGLGCPESHPPEGTTGIIIVTSSSGTRRTHCAGGVGP